MNKQEANLVASPDILTFMFGVFFMCLHSSERNVVSQYASQITISINLP